MEEYRFSLTRIFPYKDKIYDCLFGVLQGAILGPFLFEIFICDLFLFAIDKDIVSYADDITPYATSSLTNLAIEKLQVF